MLGRTQIAALDHNDNVKREQAKVCEGASSGKKRYNIVSPKRPKSCGAKPILKAKKFDYLN